MIIFIIVIIILLLMKFLLHSSIGDNRLCANSFNNYWCIFTTHLSITRTSVGYYGPINGPLESDWPTHECGIGTHYESIMSSSADLKSDFNI